MVSDALSSSCGTAALSALAAVGGGLVAAHFGLSAASAAGQVRAAAPTVITVTAGKPTEFAFQLSKKSAIPAGTVTFRVTNRGAVPHNFKVCTRPVANSRANACTGKSTPMLARGRSATLTMTLGKGTYEFLSSAPGHAAKGMKGLLGVVRVATSTPTTSTPTAPTPAPSPPATPTTAAAPAAPGTEALDGDSIAGAAIFQANGCGGCHTLAAAGATGTFAPDLDARKPSQARVRSAVTYGAYSGSGVIMPAFTLSVTDLNNLAAYIYASTQR